jgi:hypothetical protein
VNLSPNARTAVVLLVALCITSGIRYRSSSPRPFDREGFAATYEKAFRGKDLTFYDNFFSRACWVGNQFATRDQALGYLQQLFARHDDLSAQLHIHAFTVLADGRSALMNAQLTLRGRRLSDGQMEVIDEITGSSLYVYENGSWRMYKAVEKKLALAIEE